MTTPFRTHRIAVVCGLWLTLSATASAADPEFIGDFMKRNKEWDRLINITVHLEGRYASISSSRLRLQNCDLEFRGNKPLVKPRDSEVVEVIGHLTKDDGEYIFVVNRLAGMPTELFRYERMLATVNPRDPAEWHELGMWLKKRGDFYDDKRLLEKAQAAFAKELAVELNAVAPSDLKGRLKLADKVTRLGLPATQRAEIIHDAYYEQWRQIAETIKKQADEEKEPPQSLSSDDQNKLRTLIEHIARDMPGSNLPLTPLQPELMKTYLAEPIETYQAADDEKRRTLHRLLYAEALQSLIVQEAKADPAKGYAAASKIEKQVPEYPELAERLRVDQLAWERSQVATYTRRQVLELAERYKARGQADDANAALTEWLDVRRERLRADDAGEHVRLAEDYLNLVAAEEPAADLLIAAYRLTPDVPEIGRRLKQMGLVLKNDEWIRPKDLDDPEQRKLERAIREGRVEVGMTRQQIRRSLGAPTVVSRVRSLRSVNEVWMYRLSAASMLAIQFNETAGPNGPTAKNINEVATEAFTVLPEKKPATQEKAENDDEL